MASRRRKSDNNNRSTSRRKSEAEARVERITWGFLVLIFAIIYFLNDVVFPTYVVPFAAAAVLMLSGIYQYVRRWRVSPVTWVAGTVLIVLGLYSFQINQNFDPFGFSLITVALVIFAGLLTGET